MIKSIGLLMMLTMGIATAAYLPAGDECPSSGCSQKTTSAVACGTCPSTEASLTATKTCTAGECSGKECTACKAEDGKCCEGCSKTKQTSADAAEACEGCPKTKQTSADAAEACEGCPKAKQTSAGTACAEGKCTGSCAVDTTVATSAKPAEGGACSGSCGADCKECPVTAAMAKLPQMTFMVGTEKTSCPNAASEMAKASDAKIQYVVADKSFDAEGDAKLALAEATEQFVAAYVKPQVCKETGSITVAGHKACCAGTAAEMAKTASSAADNVKLTYVVGEKACNCPVEAEKLAVDSGDLKLFVVGEEKTACNVTARLNLARAKYKAAVVALMQPTSETTETSTGS